MKLSSRQTLNTWTEDEAEGAWCPFARAYDPSDCGDALTATNRPLAYHRERSEINCIGPRCMAWRWAGQNHTGEDVGFCGLAGKP
jgi:hypothetical protein